jgi:hypothetical protein
MPVIDSGRETEYDFSYQRVTTACCYDVRWRALKLGLRNDLRSVGIAKAYLAANVSQSEQLMRLIRVQSWVAHRRLEMMTPEAAILFDDYRLEVVLDYRDLRESMFPRIGSTSYYRFQGVNEGLVWDWNNVRNDLRKLFARDPHTFVDILHDLLHKGLNNKLREERNYFIMLCEEDTYVPHP